MKQLLNLLNHPENSWVTQCKSQRDEADNLVYKGWLKPNALGDEYKLALSNKERELILDILRYGPQVVVKEGWLPAISRLYALNIVQHNDSFSLLGTSYELTDEALDLLGANGPTPTPTPTPDAGSIEEILAERQTTYGDFSTQAELSQELKRLVKDAYNARPDDQRKLQDYQCEALDMILHKIARIINGDPSYVDSWADISGYATLVVKELEKQND